jgi:hypothetical protein
METKKRIIKIGKWLLFFAVILFVLLLPAIFLHTKKVALYLQAIGVCASSIIAIFAIWGEQIRARFLGPKLVLSLFKPEGEETFVSHANNEFTPIRYYHLKVENKRKGLIAQNVQVILLSIDSPDKGGKNKITSLGGRLPFPWSFRQPIKGMEEKSYYSNIGPDDLCDLANMEKGEKLKILAARWHIIIDQLLIGANQKAVIEAVAVADNTQSNRIKLEISWDGQWPKDDADAPNHIIIRKPKRSKRQKQKN